MACLQKEGRPVVIPKVHGGRYEWLTIEAGHLKV